MDWRPITFPHQAELWRPFSRDFEVRVFSFTSFASKRQLLVQSARPGRILDVGCGPLGLLLRDLASLGAEVIGADWSVDMLLECRRQLDARRVRLIAADNRCLPLASATAGTIFAVNSFLPETREEVDLMFAEARRVLTPGGRLIAVLPSFEMSILARDRWGMDLRLDVENHREYDTSGWQSFYTLADIEQLMARHGFAAYRVQRVCFDAPEEITHIREVYGASLSGVSVEKLRSEPLFEHLLDAESSRVGER